MADYKPYMDELFVDAHQVMWELSQKEGYFTFYAFMRRIGQLRQGAYVRLLAMVLEHEGEQKLFNQAHLHVGKHLSSIAQAAGYEQDKNLAIKEINIWGDPTDTTIYRRTERVQQP